MNSTLEKTDVKKEGSIFIYSDELAKFDFGPNHFFTPERASKTLELCNRYGVMYEPWMDVIKPDTVDKSHLLLFHDAEYLKILENAAKGKISLETLARGIGTEDNPILPGIFEWASAVTGGTMEALNRIASGKALVGFNPLGGFHHARAGHAEGFCYINDIVISILDLLSRQPDIRIAYIDIDAHHGNGVQEGFYDDPRVLFICTHETGKTLYPWSGSEKEIGEGKGRGYTVNIPMEPESDDEVFSLLFESLIPPLIDSFKPDIIVTEIGADALISDPLTHLKFTNNSYIMALDKMLNLCPRILALGGGGYDLYRTARWWTLAWAALNNLKPEDEFAGLVGGMMFGPEKEVGSLYDSPHFSKGEGKDKAMAEAERVIEYIQKEVFPLHNI